jgi:UDP-N-acetylmuramate-alanine ligase
MMICKENLVETIKNINFDILLTLGAGDINNYLPELVKIAKTQS